MTACKVLVVEDEPLNVKLMAALLRSPDFEMQCAGSAEDAFVLLEKEKPDVILMDIGLPGMDGYEAIKQLRLDRRFDAIPIIAVSAHARSDDEVRAKRAGASAFISKPIQVGKFVVRIREFLNPDARS